MKQFLHRLKDWEHWPFLLFYFPLSFVWGWYIIKSRAFWFFTPSNPTLAFGGFEGESKSEMYAQLPVHLYPRSVVVTPAAAFTNLLERIRAAGIRYPFIVKPDIGMKGILFRIIENENQLKTYHQHMPAQYLVQEFVDSPHEVSVFYCRMPGRQKGFITAVIQKDLMQVTGNGKATLQELLQQQPGAANLLEEIKKQQGHQLQKVLQAGEQYCLSYVGNRMNGATFINLSKQIDDQLVQLFDSISHNNQFYYGRYDIKCVSVADMKEGRNFYILEFNGAGSVPNHIYTGGYTMLQAYKEILKHWKALYQISKQNSRKGYPYWSFLKGYTFLNKSKKHFDVLKRLDKELLLK